MDHIGDKYDLFNAPQFVDFNQVMRNGGFEDDHADDYFETHREEDDFLPPQPTSCRDQAQLLVLKAPTGSQNMQREASPAKYKSVPKTPAGSNSHSSKSYTGVGIPMFKPRSSTNIAPTPNPSPSDLQDSNKKQKKDERENKTRLCYTVVKEDASKTS